MPLDDSVPGLPELPLFAAAGWRRPASPPCVGAVGFAAGLACEGAPVLPTAVDGAAAAAARERFLVVTPVPGRDAAALGSSCCSLLPFPSPAPAVLVRGAIFTASRALCAHSWLRLYPVTRCSERMHVVIATAQPVFAPVGALVLVGCPHVCVSVFLPARMIGMEPFGLSIDWRNPGFFSASRVCSIALEARPSQAKALTFRLLAAAVSGCPKDEQHIVFSGTSFYTSLAPCCARSAAQHLNVSASQLRVAAAAGPRCCVSEHSFSRREQQQDTGSRPSGDCLLSIIGRQPPRGTTQP